MTLTRQQSRLGNLHIIREYLHVTTEKDHRTANHEKCILEEKEGKRGDDRAQMVVYSSAVVLMLMMIIIVFVILMPPDTSTHLTAPLKHVCQGQIRHEDIIHANGALHLNR